jgi:hypothetical protein
MEQRYFLWISLVVGEVAGSNFMKEIGDGVQKATHNAGIYAGEFANGTFGVAAGSVTNNQQTENGFKDNPITNNIT